MAGQTWIVRDADQPVATITPVATCWIGPVAGLSIISAGPLPTGTSRERAVGQPIVEPGRVDVDSHLERLASISRLGGRRDAVDGYVRIGPNAVQVCT